MFTVAKKDLQTVWVAYAGHVEEMLHDAVGYTESYSDFVEAYAAACNLFYERARKQYKWKKEAITGPALLIYRLRALWNPKIREGLQRWQRELAAAKAEMDSEVAPTVTRIPDQIPVLGQRLAIGTPVFTVDQYALTLTEARVQKEIINYYSFYPDGAAATYELDNRTAIKSDLSSGFWNIKHYLNRDEAKNALLVLIDERIQKLQQSKESL